MAAPKEKDGGLAFPVVHPSANAGMVTVHEGMTLRDYFAAKALQALIGRSEWPEHPIAACFEAYKMADAMLAERKK